MGILRRLAAPGGAFARRLACSDAERRAALWLARELGEAGRDAELEPAWVRPHRHLAVTLAGAVGIAAAVVSIDAPAIALVLAAAAWLAALVDLDGRVSVLRLLTFRRATDVVVSPPPRRRARAGRLLLVAPVDATRTATSRARPIARTLHALRLTPRAALLLALTGVVAGCIARTAGVENTDAFAVAQLVPTVALILATAAALELALAEPSLGAREASGAAAALALAAALDRRPPRALDVEIVLAGASADHPHGLRRYVAARRRRRLPRRDGWEPTRTIALHLGPCLAGPPAWRASEGEPFPRAAHGRLRALAAEVADAHPELGARAVRFRGPSPLEATRSAGWPSLTVQAGGPLDRPEAADPDALRDVVRFALALVRRVDAEVLENLRRERAAARGDGDAEA